MNKKDWWSDMIQNKQLYTTLQNKANKIHELETWIQECLNNLKKEDKKDMPSFQFHELDAMENAFTMVSEKMKELGLTQED
jgi:hypothetical protein